MDFFGQLAARWNVESPRGATLVGTTFAYNLSYISRRPELTGDDLRGLNEVQHMVTGELLRILRGESFDKSTINRIIECATRGRVTEWVDHAAKGALESLKLHDS